MREIVNLNAGWAFTKNATELPDVFPRVWDIINLPHTWNAVDGQDGGNDYYRGKGFYVKEVSKFDLPECEKYFIEINGASSVGELYVNGRLVGSHRGGYSTWRFDVTDYLEDNNLIGVIVDNTDVEDVYPRVADFTFYGGLYRDVNLIGVDHAHFELEYYGTPGIKVTPFVDGNDANVTVEVFVKDAEEKCMLAYTIVDSDGRVVCEKEVPVSETECVFTLENVHKWHGVKDPYLYQAGVCLKRDGEVIDTVQTRFGCRSYEIDSERGFILNGEEYPLRGVSRHQDRLGVGNALLQEHHIEDMDLICEVGANTIRLAHYQHDQFFYDLCDERGIVIWAEIPYISRHVAAGRENTLLQMKELIIQNYNHPCIVVWGLSNEITIGGESEDLIENHRLLNDLCHEMDPTRKTVIAAVSMADEGSPYIHIPDVVSYNHYFGWYGGDVSDNGPWLDQFHKTYPNIPLGLSEYGCEALDWHTSDPKQGDYTEEYQAYYHEEMIKQLFSRKYLWATYVWNMFDFGADARAEGGVNGRNNKGLVTFDRKYKKDAFFAYKAWMSDVPFVHIASKRYVDRVEDVTKVTVYSNLPEVELFVNGVSVGKKACADHFFHFEVANVGESKIQAVAGACMDCSVIRKVDTFNEAYRFTESGTILNWFDITEVDGHFSLNDNLGEIMANPQGLQVVMEMLKNTPLQSDQERSEKDVAAQMKMLSSFTFIRLLNLMGVTNKNSPVSKDDLLALNQVLNKIAK